MQNLKISTLLSTNIWTHSYYVYNDRLFLGFLWDLKVFCNYHYFGKIEDDGSLTDVYKTDYDVFELNSYDVMFSRPYSEKSIRRDYFLTNDADKQGKVECSSYITKYDEPTTNDYEQYYLTCPDNVFDKLKNSQNSGLLLPRSYVLGQEDYIYADGVYASSENDSGNRIYRAYMGAVLLITDLLTSFKDSILTDDYEYKKDNDMAYIGRADVDLEAGKILSGELVINGEKNCFPDDNLADSSTVIDVYLHKRPDSIFEKNKELLRENFDKSYLESLKYQTLSEIYEETYLAVSNLAKTNGLECATYDYEYEDGQAVVSGICKFEDGYYRYVYILPYAGFFEAFAPCILEVMLKVWIPGLIVAALLATAVSRKRY